MFLCAVDFFFGVAALKLDFYEIPEEGLTLIFEDATWLAAELENHGPVSASLFLKRFGQRVIVTGSLTVTILVDCDRCLEKFDLLVDSDFKVDLELSTMDNSVQQSGDYHCHDNEMDIVFLADSEIDARNILQQQLDLALPMKRLCSKKCLGICKQCGANLNLGKCGCSEDNSSPFQVLAKLKR